MPCARRILGNTDWKPHYIGPCPRSEDVQCDRKRNPALRAAEQHRRHCVFANVRRTARRAMTHERVANFAADDWRTNLPNFSRAAAVSESEIGRAPSRYRESPQAHAGRSGHCPDDEQPIGDRRDCRLPECEAGFWSHRERRSSGYFRGRCRKLKMH
jgi:hypothetical protein